MATAKKAAKAATPPRKTVSAKAAPRKTAKPTAAPMAGAATADAAKAAKPEKARKPKLVRDSFTIPKTEYAVLDVLKQRAAKAGTQAKKSEVLRAGIKALAGMDDAAFVAAMGAVPAIKTGRPAKS
ncbi:MAG TPA: hypothetical protein VLI46_14910 [Ramlibacter sp.]|nr:hypothetical protein [Ramlibacter sp.]